MDSMSCARSFSFDRQAMYRIRVEGTFDPSWSDRLGGMAISSEHSSHGPPTTTLVGELCDQASLAGVLNMLYELHCPVLLVERLPAEHNAADEIVR
jgi:hypothetical protein